jgi:hypothetical protein
VLELQALDLILSEVFHKGQLLHNTDTSTTNDLINWTTETESREIHVLSILLPDLTMEANQQDNRVGNLPRKRRPPHARVLPNQELPEQGHDPSAGMITPRA